MTNKKLSLTFNDSSEIMDFIHNTESGIYEGINSAGQDTIILLDKSIGMNVKTLQTNNWWVVHEYDEFGYLVSERYEK